MSDINVLLERLERLLENVHQYVGARYVPNFIDEPWSDIRGYEALDVVDNGTGTSYIAKKPVPPGTPLSNREYWFVYGSTSGAIINLQNQIDMLTSMYLHREYTYVGADNSKILFLADSFGMVNYGDWCNYVSNKMGGGVVIDATAGADLSVFATKLAAIDDGDYTDILIIGGTNDIYTDYQAIVNHYNNFKAVATKFKETKLHYGFVATRYGNASQRALIKPCETLYRKMCGELGIRYLGNFNKYLYPAFHFLKGDGIHPNVLGGQRLASAIGYRFNKCCDIVNGYETYTATENSLEFNVMFDIHDDCVYIQLVPHSGSGLAKTATYTSIAPPSGNYTGYGSAGNVDIHVLHSQPNADIYYTINNKGILWAALGSNIDSYSTYGFNVNGFARCNIDAAVNE